MFILYINALPKVQKYRKASPYANDAKKIVKASDIDSREKIQEDLNSVAEWCNKWRLQLNTSKCFLIQYIQKNQNAEYPTFHLNGVRINARQSISDLGIIISEGLKFNQQVAAASKKAHREIGYIKRSFISRSPQFLSNMFKLFVPPHLEYCVQLWNPVYICENSLMEKVQNRFTKLFRQGSVHSPTMRNAALEIWTHEVGKVRGDLIYMHKLSAETNFFQQNSSSRTRENSRKIYLPMIQNNTRRHSFVMRRVGKWNTQPNCVVESVLDVWCMILHVWVLRF